MTAIQPDDFPTQQQRKTKAEMLEALAKQESQQTSIRDALFAEIDKLNELWLREFNTIKAEAGPRERWPHRLADRGRLQRATRKPPSASCSSSSRAATSAKPRCAR